MSSTSDLVGLAVDEMRSALMPALDRTWEVPAGDLEWTCRATAAHVADDLFSYASQVLAQPDSGFLPVEVVIDPRASNAEILRAVEMCGRLLSNAVDSAAPDARAWHPCGTSDPEGFAAMGIVEVLVHAYDMAKGLELDWTPPSRLCTPVLQRLFPGAPEGDASQVLLYLTGRQALAGKVKLTDWSWDSSVRSDSGTRTY
jgi:hypothetical protein